MLCEKTWPLYLWQTYRIHCPPLPPLLGIIYDHVWIPTWEGGAAHSDYDDVGAAAGRKPFSRVGGGQNKPFPLADGNKIQGWDRRSSPFKVRPIPFSPFVREEKVQEDPTTECGKLRFGFQGLKGGEGVGAKKGRVPRSVC